MSRKITERQAQILIFIDNFITQNKYSPTVREIGGHFCMSPKGAHDHVKALERKGCITSEHKKSRTIQIIVKKQGEKP